MERLVYQPSCGCQVYRIMHSKPNLYRIQYCPLHKEAPRLYEACKLLVAQSERFGVWCVGPDEKPIAGVNGMDISKNVAVNAGKQAIAGVEGK